MHCTIDLMNATSIDDNTIVTTSICDGAYMIVSSML